jgi:D-xylose transport system ATP-binding protein
MALAETVPTAQGRPPILTLKGIWKRFGAVEALRDVDLEVYPAEVVALVGDNGAGKSTLVKVIAGIGVPDEGAIEFEGRPVTIHGPRDATQLGIATVYQDLALCDNLDVVANLFLGREEVSPFHILEEEAMEKRAIDVLQSLSVKLPSVRTAIAGLSGGQRQSVAVARSVLWDAKVVLLDEPTAALGVAQTRQVLDLIRRLKEKGLAVVVISHNLADVFDACDRIVILRLGKLVADLRVAEATREQVVAAITGAELSILKNED